MAQGTWTLLVATMSQLCRNYVQLVLELHFVQIFRGLGWKRREGMSCLAHALSASMNSSKFRQVDSIEGN